MEFSLQAAPLEVNGQQQAVDTFWIDMGGRLADYPARHVRPHFPLVDSVRIPRPLLLLIALLAFVPGGCAALSARAKPSADDAPETSPPKPSGAPRYGIFGSDNPEPLYVP